MRSVSNGATSTPMYRRVRVAKVLSSRYGLAERPESWDRRRAGTDIVVIDGGETLKLYSTPMQSPPKLGWVLMLTGGTSEQGFSWTLYGMSRG
jgi:hypothetical protein